MKKFFAVLFSVVMVFFLVACAETDGFATQSNGPGSTDRPAPSAAAPASETAASVESAAPISEVGVPQSEESKILVVYFSASGNTERVAGCIADELNADTFELVPAEPYSDADLNWRDRSSRVNKEHDDPALQDVELASTQVPDWSAYDMVLFGYPLWWREAPWVVNRFVQSNDFTGKTVIPFCTSSSNGLGDSGVHLAELAGTGNWLAGERFRENPSEDSVREWVRSLDLE